MYLLFYLIFCVFIYSLDLIGPHPQHVEVPRLGVKLELQLLACTTAHSNTRTIPNWARPGIKTMSSYILVEFVTAEPNRKSMNLDLNCSKMIGFIFHVMPLHNKFSTDDISWNAMFSPMVHHTVIVLNGLDGQMESNCAEWIHPHGNRRPLWASGSLLWTVLHHLCHISGWLGHDHPHQVGPTSTDTHVLLSQTPSCHWSWLFSAVRHKMLVNFVADWNTISYDWCATQLTFFILFIFSELFILSAMAFDCYMAICDPRLCMVVMSQRVCWVLVTVPDFTVSLFLW